MDYTGMELPEGGTSIPYWMEDPYLRKEYEGILAKEGDTTRMDQSLYDVPPEYKDYVYKK